MCARPGVLLYDCSFFCRTDKLLQYYFDFFVFVYVIIVWPSGDRWRFGVREIVQKRAVGRLRGVSGSASSFLLVWPVRGRFVLAVVDILHVAFAQTGRVSELCLYIMRQGLVTVLFISFTSFKIRRDSCSCAQLNSTGVCCTFQWKWRPHMRIRRGL